MTPARIYRQPRSLWAALLLLVALISGGCGGGSAAATGGGKGAETKAKPQSATPVNLVPARREDVPILLEAVGTLRANQIANIAPQIAGTIASINFEDGQRVKKGQVLFTLDHSVQLANYQAARSAYQQAKWTYQKTAKLYKQNAATAYEASQDKFARDSAKAQAEQARATLRKTVIHAPFSGKLGLHQHDVGDYLQAGTTMVRLAQDNPMLVDYQLPGQDVEKVKLGQPVYVTDTAASAENAMPPGPGQNNQPADATSASNGGGSEEGGASASDPSGQAGSSQGAAGQAATHLPSPRANWHKGKVTATSPGVDPSTRSLSVRGVLLNTSHQLTSGQFMRVEQQVGVRQNTVLIPQQAVVQADIGTAVWVVDHGVAHQQPVTLGDYTGNDAIVTKGLRGDEQVVLTGWQNLHKGAKVKTVNAPGPEPEKGGANLTYGAHDSANSSTSRGAGEKEDAGTRTTTQTKGAGG